MAKETKIELEIPQGRVAFPVEQADGLLRMKFNGGWKLPEDSVPCLQYNIFRPFGFSEWAVIFYCS